MSNNNQVLNNGSQAITNYDLSKIFVWNNRYYSGLYTNSIYNPETLQPGTLLGRVAATNQLVKCFATAVDGSQYPVGVVADQYVIVAGSTQRITYCAQGDVVADQIIFMENDGFNTVVNGRTLLDLIQAQGIKVVFNTEMTDYDNQ